MSPVTLEDMILSYYEHADGCTASFVSPPPPACPHEVQQAYAFGQTHILTIAFAAFFLLAIIMMIFGTIFPSEAHH